MRITLVVDGRTLFDLTAGSGKTESKTESKTENTLLDEVVNVIKGPISTFGIAVDKIYDGIFNDEE